MQQPDSMPTEFEIANRVRAKFADCTNLDAIKNLLKEKETSAVNKSIHIESIKKFIIQKEQQIKDLMEKQTGFVKQQKAHETMVTGKLIQSTMGEVKEAQQIISTIESAIYKEKAQHSMQTVLNLDVNKAEKNDLLLAKMELQRMNKAISGNKNFDPNNVETTRLLETISKKIALIEQAVDKKNRTLEDVFNMDNSPKSSPLRK